MLECQCTYVAEWGPGVVVGEDPDPTRAVRDGRVGGVGKPGPDQGGARRQGQGEISAVAAGGGTVKIIIIIIITSVIIIIILTW